MLLQHPFSALTPTVDGDVLHVLAATRDDFTIQRLAALTPTRSTGGIRNAVERLSAQGVVFRRDVGRTRLYSLNDDHLFANALRAIANARVALLARLRDEVEAWPNPPLYGALFGSAARGDMTIDSDLDIFLLCPDVDEEWDDAISELITAATSWTGNDSRVVELYEPDLRAPEHRPLLEAVRREGVSFAGDRDWLTRALARSSST